MSGTLPIEAIRSLPAFDVGKRLGIITQEVANPQPNRFALEGSTNSTPLQFFADGGFYNHKNGSGGTCIDLVLQYLGGPSRTPDQSRFKEACEVIQAGFNLQPPVDHLEKRSRGLSAALRKHGGHTPKSLARILVKD